MHGPARPEAALNPWGHVGPLQIEQVWAVTTLVVHLSVTIHGTTAMDFVGRDLFHRKG